MEAGEKGRRAIKDPENLWLEATHRCDAIYRNEEAGGVSRGSRVLLQPCQVLNAG